MTEIQRSLLTKIAYWFSKNGVNLPWRESATPYHVWLSEIMLQQTRIEAVIPYYHRFLSVCPTLQDLANCSEDHLLKLWEGLGYYSRVRNMKKTAMLVMTQHGGALPSDVKTLTSLPGIGSYTAGAIASIAYHKPTPAVDGNVLRVLSRIRGDFRDIALEKTKKEVTKELQAHYLEGELASHLTQGLMELGERICIPNGAPHCELCPVKDRCVAYRENKQKQLPVKSGKPERTVEQRTIFVLTCKDCYALQKRGKGLLAGMWEYPSADGKLTIDKAKKWIADQGAEVIDLHELKASKHIFTHKEWHMTGYLITLAQPLPHYVWATTQQIQTDYALPTAFKSYTQAILNKKE